MSKRPDRKQEKKERFVILLEERSTCESAAGFKMKNKRTSRDFLATWGRDVVDRPQNLREKGFNKITTEVNGFRN